MLPTVRSCGYRWYATGVREVRGVGGMRGRAAQGLACGTDAFSSAATVTRDPDEHVDSDGGGENAVGGKTRGGGRGRRTDGKEKRPRGFWAEKENRIQFLKEVRSKLGITDVTEWQRVRHQEILALGGGGLMARYQNSLQKALEELYEDEKGSGDAFRPKAGRGHWASQETQRAFMERVREEKGVTDAADWRRVTTNDIVEMGGSTLLSRYNNSVLNVLRAVYPERRWSAVLHRPHVPRGYWEVVENQREFLDYVAEALGVRRPEDWSRVRNVDIIRLGGRGFIEHCGTSLAGTLKAVYGSGEDGEDDVRGVWSLHNCRSTVKSEYWESDDNVRAFVLDAAVKLSIEDPHDWYRVSQRQIRELNGTGLLSRMPFVDALRLAYPDHTWDAAQCSRSVKKSSQRTLFYHMKELFPHEEWLEDYKHPSLASAGYGALELDVFSPTLQLACEYQGAHHYNELPFFGPLEVHQRRDKQKEEQCESLGIRLLHVPYWWDNRLPTLAATLEREFPGILTQ